MPSHPVTPRPGATYADTAPPCSIAGLAAGEPLAGSAPEYTAWVLVEHAGPWGREAPLHAPWPNGIGPKLAAATAAAGVRLLLMRPHRAQPIGGPPTVPAVILARTGPEGWAVTRRMGSVNDLLDLPLADVAAGRRPHGDVVPWRDAGSVWGVCTHGTRDACCARAGRSLAAALARSAPGATWEISHSGGHRFAGVVMTWPEGIAYGRVTPERIPDLVLARARSRMVLDLARGRCDLPPPLQVADVALRRQLDEPTVDAVTLHDHVVGPDGIWTSWWRAHGQRWQIEVGPRDLPPRPASCGAEPVSGQAWHAGLATPAQPARRVVRSIVASAGGGGDDVRGAVEDEPGDTVPRRAGRRMQPAGG